MASTMSSRSLRQSLSCVLEQLLRGRPRGVSSQASELHEREIGITPFDCPRDISRQSRKGRVGASAGANFGLSGHGRLLDRLEGCQASW